MQPNDLEILSTILKTQSGISIGPEKSYLYEARLMPIVRTHKLDTIKNLVSMIKKGDQSLTQAFIEVMTTNETSFYRDLAPFQTFEKEILPRLIEKNAMKRKIRIWSAACSTGQECYSLAMILDQHKAKFPGWKIEILGTDLCNKALAKARVGKYFQFEVQRGLPIQNLVKYFQKEEEQWVIKDTLRENIQFHHFNLLDSFAKLGQFDVIFCRNVLFYFEKETKVNILKKIYQSIVTNGSLFLGGSESLTSLTSAFASHPQAKNVYVKRDQAEIRALNNKHNSLAS